jgi:hypothetical protein
MKVKLVLVAATKKYTAKLNIQAAHLFLIRLFLLNNSSTSVEYLILLVYIQ